MKKKLLFSFSILFAVAAFSQPSASMPEHRATVTFMIRPEHGYLNELNEVEETIAMHFIANEHRYYPKYVRVNYDSVFAQQQKQNSQLSYWENIRNQFSAKRRYRQFARAAGTDHLMTISIETEFDTIITPGQKYSLLSKLLFKMQDEPDKQTLAVRKIRFKLLYIDGRTGKTLWSMKSKYPSGFFGINRTDPLQVLRAKLEKKFPYKKANL